MEVCFVSIIDEQTYNSIYNSFFHDTRKINIYHVSIPMTSNVRITHKQGIVNQGCMSLKTSFVRYIFILADTRERG
jgi:hypothetical protein